MANKITNFGRDVVNKVTNYDMAARVITSLPIFIKGILTRSTTGKLEHQLMKHLEDKLVGLIWSHCSPTEWIIIPTMRVWAIIRPLPSWLEGTHYLLQTNFSTYARKSSTCKGYKQ